MGLTHFGSRWTISTRETTTARGSLHGGNTHILLFRADIKKQGTCVMLLQGVVHRNQHNCNKYTNTHKYLLGSLLGGLLKGF